jgi:hypothetical protein
LTPPDFFLCGHLKGHAYMNKPCTLDEIQAVTPEVLATIRNMQRRVQLRIEAQGGHFRHLL